MHQGSHREREPFRAGGIAAMVTVVTLKEKMKTGSTEAVGAERICIRSIKIGGRCIGM